MFFPVFSSSKCTFAFLIWCVSRIIFSMWISISTLCHVNNLPIWPGIGKKTFERRRLMLHTKFTKCKYKAQTRAIRWKFTRSPVCSCSLPTSVWCFLDFSSPHFELCVRYIITLSHIHLNKFGKWDVNNEHYIALFWFSRIHVKHDFFILIFCPLCLALCG